MQRPDVAQWIVERSLDRSRGVLRYPLDEVPLKEHATGFHRPRRVKGHGIFLPVMKNQKALFIDDQATPVHNPLDLSVDDGLDRQRSGKIIDDVLSCPTV